MKNKISLIIQREYLTRVKKKSFIIMTILAPILFASVVFIPFLLQSIDSSKRIIAVVDNSGIVQQQLENNKDITFLYTENLATSKDELMQKKIDAILFINKTNNALPDEAVLYFAEKEPGLNLNTYIEKQLQTLIRNKILIENYHINPDEYSNISNLKIKIKPENITTGENTDTGIKTAIGYISGFLIYMFVFMFGAQVMNGVIEEKRNRIIEVIVSSVKPFQLMSGKIIGVALVGLTQFLLWIVLTLGIVTIGGVTLFNSISNNNITKINENIAVNNTIVATNTMTDNTITAEVFENLNTVDWYSIILFFLIYFIGGYLLYSSLFAAVGSTVDNESETQQFMLPLTIPLIIAIVSMAMVMENPNGNVAFWLSMIPFTSPIIMMMRIPFGVPAWELCASIFLLIAGFIATTWLAAKIYRTGILMYGKKVTYAELWKWLKFKN